MYSTQSFACIFCTFSHLLSPPFRVNMVTTKGKKPEITEENTMNEKTAKQIENLKKQTIGVEIEMNHITRERAARLAADHFGTQIRIHRKPKRLQYLVSMGCTRQRMEISKRRQHCRMRCRKVRTGHADSEIRGH